MEKVKKFLRLRTLVALASLVVVVMLLTAAPGIGQINLNQPPNGTSTQEVAPASTDSVEPAEVFFAVVRGNGTLDRGQGAVFAQRLARGQYEVIFFRNVRNCAYVATLGEPDSIGIEEPGEITVAGRAGNPRGVFVATFNSTGTDFANHSFHLQVSC